MAKKTNVRRRAKRRRQNPVFWIALVLFAAPFLILGWFLLSAALDRGSPILGDRYKDDLNPAITKADLTNITEEARKVSGVKSANTQLATGTLRVYANIADDADEEQANATADQLYSVVTGILEPSVYFSQHDNEKMYDLEIHVYNRQDPSQQDEDSFVYVINTKTSSMDAPEKQTVSKPVNADLAQQLRQAVEDRKNPTPSPTSAPSEMTLGEGDTENGQTVPKGE